MPVDIVVTGECSNGCIITWRPMPGMRRITLPASMIEHADLCQVRPVPVEYMTVAEVARYLRVSKMTVYRAINAGALASTRIGRQFRVTQTDVDTWTRSMT